MVNSNINLLKKPKGVNSWAALGFLADGRPVGNCFNSGGGFGVVWTDGEPQPLIVNGRKGSVNAVGPDWIAGSISQAGSRFRQAVVWCQEGLTFRPEIIGEAKKHTEALGVRLAKNYTGQFSVSVVFMTKVWKDEESVREYFKHQEAKDRHIE
jgi:hypothetical protein